MDTPIYSALVAEQLSQGINLNPVVLKPKAWDVRVVRQHMEQEYFRRLVARKRREMERAAQLR